jgi:nitroreductase
MNPDDLLAFLKSRRVNRNYTDEPVSVEMLTQITEAGRWATSGGNQHLHKFLIVRDPAMIQRIRTMSPGMLSLAPALIVILTDRQRALEQGAQIDEDQINYVDVGTAAMNMALQIHALGLGSCPVTSFSQSGVAVMLGLPAHLTPEFVLMVGHPDPRPRPKSANPPKSITARELTFWERADNLEPNS